MHNSWALADHAALGQTWGFILPSAQDAPRNKGTFLLLKHWGPEALWDLRASGGAEAKRIVLLPAVPVCHPPRISPAAASYHPPGGTLLSTCLSP